MSTDGFGDLLDDVSRLSAALARGEVSAVEVVTEQLRRLRLVHEKTNCVAAWNDDDARATAARLDDERRRNGPVGRLHGVPFTVKDWIDVAGMPCTGGFAECRDRIPGYDATVVARMRGQGAIVIAKTAVQVESDLFGRGAQSARPHALAGWIQQRRGRRGRRRRLGHRARERLRWEHPPALPRGAARSR